MRSQALSRSRTDAPSQARTTQKGEHRDLSLRQQQILDKLRAGKVNKEIANELGIGLGTVKQHVVALFKKLAVSNRAMAVSRGMQMQPAPRVETVPHLVSEGSLEYRPCVVLSVALPETVPESLGRKMHQVLATFASDHDALFLARKGHAGDLILGIQRASEQDLFLALRAARMVVSELAAVDAPADALRGGLTAGLAIASMHRTGGGSGEAIASSAIAQARELADSAAPGQLSIAAAARELLRVLNPNSPGTVAESLPFASIEDLPWQPGGAESLPCGREAELRRIDDLLEQAKGTLGSLLMLAGETGMGKSRLCRYDAERVALAGGRVHHFVCRPDGDLAIPYVSTGGTSMAGSALFNCLAGASAQPPEAVIVDDCHFLPPAEMARLSRQAVSAQGNLVLLAARRFSDAVASPAQIIRLGRLAPDAIAQLARATLGPKQTLTKVESITLRAAGVPLFALELARQRKPGGLPLSLRLLIGARMDGLKLDLALLRRIARARVVLDVPRLARDMQEPLEAVQAAAALAIAAGVLSQDDSGKLRFAHPLLRQAIDLAGVE